MATPKIEALSKMVGFEIGADFQIEVMMQIHALTAQLFIMCSTNYIDKKSINWKEANHGEKTLLKLTEDTPKLYIRSVPSLLDLAQANENASRLPRSISRNSQPSRYGHSAGYYHDSEFLRFNVNLEPILADDRRIAETQRRIKQ